MDEHAPGQRISLARAARLLGVSRGVLQRKVRLGELEAFDGSVPVDALARAFPHAALDADPVLLRIERIKDTAFGRRVRELVLPPSEVLAARLADLGRDLAGARNLLEAYRGVLGRLGRTLDDLIAESQGEARSGLVRLRHWLRDDLEREVLDVDPAHPLLIHESFLRIMAAQVRVEPSGREFFVDGTDAVLDAGLKAGLALPYGCSAGNCGQCKARLVSGEVTRLRHHDYVLTEAEKASGTFLMCAHTAATDLVVEAREAGSAEDIPRQQIAARVKRTERLGENVLLLHLQTPRAHRLRFLAGQRVALELPGGLAGALPIASCPCDDRNLQFHVSRRLNDPFRAHLFETLRPADLVTLTGPEGSFTYDDTATRPVVFVAVDTGFAPIKSLAEHVMALDAVESMHLYWLASSRQGRYLHNLCRAWADALDHFHYVPLDLPEGGDDDALVLGGLLQRVIDDHPDIAEVDIFAAAPPRSAKALAQFFREHGAPGPRLRIEPVPD